LNDDPSVSFFVVIVTDNQSAYACEAKLKRGQ